MVTTLSNMCDGVDKELVTDEEVHIGTVWFTNPLAAESGFGE